jgi:hypothetical protein
VDLESNVKIGGMWVKITAKWFNKFSSKADFSRIAFFLQISFSIVRFLMLILMWQTILYRV